MTASSLIRLPWVFPSDGALTQVYCLETFGVPTGAIIRPLIASQRQQVCTPRIAPPASLPPQSDRPITGLAPNQLASVRGSPEIHSLIFRCGWWMVQEIVVAESTD